MRRAPLPMPAGLLLMGLLLASLPAAARIVPPPAPEGATTGGVALPAPATGCRCDPSVAAFAAWFLWPQMDWTGRAAASDRLALAAGRPVWRAPRFGFRPLLFRPGFRHR